MIQVLIVDDDSLLCRAMANKLEYVNQEGGLDLAPAITAGTAREALAIIREKPVDILITDVQMPYQSGLELIDAVRGQFPLMQLVVLSGYSDYDYMRSALRSGVTDYLLKPVKILQLKEIIQKCIDNIHANLDSGEALAIQKQAALNDRTGKYCNALLLRAPAPARPEGLTQPAFFAAVFSAGCPDDRFSELLRQFSQKTPPESPLVLRSFQDVNQSQILLANAPEDEGRVRAYLERFCAFAAEKGLACRCGVSRAGGSLDQFPKLHRQAGYALAHQMIQSFTVKMAEEAPEKLARSPEDLFHKSSRRIQAAFQSRNFGQIYAALNEVFTLEYVSAHQAALGDILDYYNGFSDQIRQLSTALQVDLERIRSFPLFTSLDDLRSYFQELLYRLQWQSEKETEKTHYVITQAISYMERHYNQDINMKDVAAAMNMSYTYFSKFFKEQTHQSFSECLTSIRMGEAKRLIMEDPSIKIKEVAHLVGYESVYSFSRAFKQYYKVSPTALSGGPASGRGGR